MLSRARLLVTNDTGTMHLAAGLGVPCLALFLATAQPCDTGPYLPGCCCLEPALPCHPCPYNRPCPNGFACVRRISAGSVGDLALAWLRTGAWENAPIPGIEREARIWLTGRDGRGFASVRRLTALPPDPRSLWLVHQRVFWGQLFDALGPGPHPAPLPLPDISVYPEPARRALGETLGQAAALLDLLVEQGGMLGKSAMAGTLFLRNCERLQAILDASAELRALGGFWRVLRQECGDRKEDLLETLARLARHMARWRDLFADGTAFASG